MTNNLEDKRFKVWVRITAKGMNDIGRKHKWTGVGCMEVEPYVWKSKDAQEDAEGYNTKLSKEQQLDLVRNNLVYDEVLEKTARDLIVKKFPVGKYGINRDLSTPDAMKDDIGKNKDIFNSFVLMLEYWESRSSRGTYKTRDIYEFEVEHFDEAPPTKGVDKFEGGIAFSGCVKEYNYNQCYFSSPAIYKLICQRREFHNGINPDEIREFTCHIQLPSITNPLERKNRYSKDEDSTKMKRYLTFQLRGFSLTDAVEKFLNGEEEIRSLNLAQQTEDLKTDIRFGGVYIGNPFSNIWGVETSTDLSDMR